VAQQGIVKWFNSQKGFVEQAGLSQLNENQKVPFETETGRNGKVAAVNLKVI
jgi:cold shock protein